jgi:pyrroline-5-carboxylate reductase
MRRISIFGAGHLATSLIKGLGTITDQPISLYSRNPEKANNLVPLYSHLKVVQQCTDLTGYSSIIFILIPPSAVLELDQAFIKEINERDSVIVSCANYLTIEKLSRQYPGTKIIRLLPNILWGIKEGVSIYSSNSVVTISDVEEFTNILSPISMLIQATNDEDFRKIGNLTSCGPGIFSYLIDQLCLAFNITDPVQKQGVLKTLSGTIAYSSFTEKEFTEIISEVSNKGGLTESGIAAMKKKLPLLLNEISHEMDLRFQEKTKYIS